MKTILFLTGAYPYFPGEQFIENEIGYWAAQSSAKVVIVPLTASGIPRDVPESINVDCSLAQRISLISKLTSAAKAITSNIFWREVCYISTTRKSEFRSYVQALISVANLLRIERAIKKICAKHQNNIIAYCYWNENQSYAVALLKRKGLISKVISRAHGFDLYEERRPGNYMPLKRQFVKENDIILAISNQGKSYLESKYSVLAKNIIVSPLGVLIPSSMSLVSPINHLNIVSVSFCISIKRIDKIIDAIAEAAIRMQTNSIQWRHIGGGPLLPNLEMRATEKLGHLSIDWCFLGDLPNSQVREYFQSNPVDLFINTSETEGVPVSIMEAMSYGVPAIAPDVGGIAELITNENGCLISQTPNIPEIASAIVNMMLRGKEQKMRQRARQKIIENYNAETNYRSLTRLICD